MSKSFEVTLQKVVDHSYSIEIGEHLSASLVRDLQQGLLTGISKYAIITDSTVELLYGRPLLELLRHEGFQVELFSFPAGRARRPGRRRQCWKTSC